MTSREIVAEVERRAAEAGRTPHGADYGAIGRAVAAEAGRSWQDVRALLLSAWGTGGLWG